MFDLVKKALYTGVGLAVLTRDKAEELGRELARQAELSETEGQKLVDDLLAKSDQAQKDVREQVDRLVRQALEQIPMATRDEVKRLSDRVTALEAALAVQASSASSEAGVTNGDPEC